ncbi:hypothetical protein GJ629_05805 [Halapricum sp. CBA1109]|uniref:hypothetical protein n=1 Tax=Halapricum sp. CBA1109 TaxID=2668068 RepID=UPI0012FC8B84|nr:hypothetical protein [Halapricum sp. CBA1109]MUV89470.1 hypothetical protein [Halapricum sp. CBA1109]
MSSKLLKLVYGAVAVKGLFTAIAPKTSLKLNLSALGLSLENVSELEPREWYVDAVRATGVGMLAAGGVGLLLTGDDESENEADDVDPIDISPDEEA